MGSTSKKAGALILLLREQFRRAVSDHAVGPQCEHVVFGEAQEAHEDVEVVFTQRGDVADGARWPHRRGMGVWERATFRAQGPS